VCVCVLVLTEWWGAGVVICLERGAVVSCFSKIQICFTFLVPAHLGSPGKRAVKRVCVCVAQLSPLMSYCQLLLVSLFMCY